MSNFCFLTYLNRSGSTLLAKKLAQYKDIGVGIEAKLIDGIQRGSVDIKNEDDLDQYLDLNYKDPKFRSWKISKEELKNRVIEKYNFPIRFNHFLETAFELYFKNDPKKIYIHKQGRYFNHIKKIRKLFPNAKFIFIQRDPRAIYNSQKKATNSTDGSPMQTDIVKFALGYKKVQKLLKQYVNENYFHIIRYEKLLYDEVNEMNDILDFLKVNPLISDKDNYYNRIPKHQQNLHLNLKNNMNKNERIDAWKNELENWEVLFLQKVLKKELNVNTYNYFANINIKIFSKDNIFMLQPKLIKFYELFFLKNTKKLIKRIVN